MHSSVASLAFSTIGVPSIAFKKKLDTIGSSATAKKNNDAAILFNIENTLNFKSTFLQNFFPKVTNISFTTHNTVNGSFDFIFPTTSLYERSGHFSILEGRLRKHSKSVGKPKNVFSREMILTVLAARKNRSF
jgi:NADH dehydrogenase/NADH:ubiquinone oxidoreductase subunit G